MHADRLTEPMMWTPRILSVLASLSSLTRPSASAVVYVWWRVVGRGKRGGGSGYCGRTTLLPCVLLPFTTGRSDMSQLHSPLVFALLLAEKGNFPVLYSTPSSFSCSSDLPTHATSWSEGGRRMKGWVGREGRTKRCVNYKQLIDST